MKQLLKTISFLSMILTVIAVVAYFINKNENLYISNFILKNNYIGDIWLTFIVASIISCIGSYIYGFINNDYYKVSSFCLLMIGISLILFLMQN